MDDLDHRIDRVLEETGLATIADRRVKILSGGQKRRLGLAMELVSSPELLLCDEVTSGLDPRSEREIVNLLHDLSRKDGRTVISVTHSLAHLELYDSILVLHEGCVAYHGPPGMLTHYFTVDDTEEIYPKLAKQSGPQWQRSWAKHRVAYYEKLERNRDRLIEARKLDVPPPVSPSDQDGPSRDEDAGNMAPHPIRCPGIVSQFSTLLSRRWKIFFRDRGQVFLQLAILICFPVLVILFSQKGQDPIRKLSNAPEENLYLELQNKAAVHNDQLPLSGAVLALPENIEVLTRPFISAYWAWSGGVDALQTNVFTAVKVVIDTSLSPHNVCVFVLGSHILIGVVGAWIGTHRNQWD